MGRKRNRLDQWMPPRVYRGKSAYEWKPKGGGTVRLCELDATRTEVYQAWEEAQNSGQFNVSKLFNEYFSSIQFLQHSKVTRIDYEQSKKVLLLIFGKAKPDDISTVMVRKYMDKRGLKSKTRANRERALLSTVYAWSIERGYVSFNPAKNVKPFKENKRDRYVTDKEYDFVYAQSPDAVKIAMELAYLCAMRQKDILSLTYAQCTHEGIDVTQSKTGKRQIKKWTDRLRAAISLSRKTSTTYICKHVVHTKSGGGYTSDGFKSVWQKVMKEALANGLGERFTFHDLKAKGISDYQGDKRKFSGHKTQAQVETYNRLPDVVDSLEK